VKKTTTRGSLVLFAIMLLALPLIYALLYYFHVAPLQLHEAYWNSLFGNWLATSLGIVAGFPVALYLNEYASRSARRQQDMATSEQLSRTRKHLLALATRELEAALDSTQLVSAGEIEHFANASVGFRSLVAMPIVAETLDADTIIVLVQASHALELVHHLGLTWISARGLKGQTESSPLMERYIRAAAADATNLAQAALDHLAKTASTLS